MGSLIKSACAPRKPLLTILLLWTLAAAGANGPGETGAAGAWSEDMKTAVTDGCRQTMLRAALERYRGTHGLRRSQLPQDLEQRLEAALADELAVCGCITERIADRWAFAYFMREQAQLSKEIGDYIRSGACRPSAGDAIQ